MKRHEGKVRKEWIFASGTATILPFRLWEASQLLNNSLHRERTTKIGNRCHRFQWKRLTPRRTCVTRSGAMTWWTWLTSRYDFVLGDAWFQHFTQIRGTYHGLISPLYRRIYTLPVTQRVMWWATHHWYWIKLVKQKTHVPLFTPAALPNWITTLGKSPTYFSNGIEIWRLVF